jgi:uncharacterized membrane protein YdbT with pleckstrin-like domain
MSYVESQLLSGEEVVYRAHRHKMLFAAPAVLALATVVMAIFAFGTLGIWPVVGFWFIAAGVAAAISWIIYTTSEFAVTNKRVVMKVGWIRRRSVEVLLSKVEAIRVDQGLLGRMFDYGSIEVTGTGGTHEPFRQIAAPLEFRRQVQDVASRLEEARVGAKAPDGATAAPASREERDCPFCAERILVKAKVCKHCGRDVSAVQV